MKQRTDTVQDWAKIRTVTHKVNLDARYVLAYLYMVRDGRLLPPDEKALQEAERDLGGVSPK